MSTALCLLCYCALLVWAAPVALRRLTQAGASARLTVAAWLAAIASSLAAWTAAVVLLVVTAVDNVRTGAAVAICLRFLGLTSHIDVPGQRWIVDIATVATLLISGIFVNRAARGMHLLHARSINHARDVHIVGTPHPDGVIVITAAQPSTYCVAGRPSAIVVTTAALSTLTRPQFAAVLSHEKAHLRGRHHHILVTLRALVLAAPGLPLIAHGAVAVSQALEMCADDAAVRRHGAATLLSGLLRLAGHPDMATQRMGAADSAVVIRALRLAAPARPSIQWALRLYLTATTTALIAIPAAVEWLCHH